VWEKCRKSKNRPSYNPSNPNRTFRKKWKGWSDWLGKDRVQNQKKELLPFEKAREFAHALGLRSWTEWTEYRKSDKRPKNIPSAPDEVYKDEGWTSLGDWLGTGGLQINRMVVKWGWIEGFFHSKMQDSMFAS
jgi:hypothetical protein